MKKERVRINLNVSTDVKDRIESLVERTECDNMTEVIRRALSLLDLLTTADEEGASLFIRRADGTVTQLIIVE